MDTSFDAIFTPVIITLIILLIVQFVSAVMGIRSVRSLSENRRVHNTHGNKDAVKDLGPEQSEGISSSGFPKNCDILVWPDGSVAVKPTGEQASPVTSGSTGPATSKYMPEEEVLQSISAECEYMINGKGCTACRFSDSYGIEKCLFNRRPCDWMLSEDKKKDESEETLSSGVSASAG